MNALSAFSHTKAYLVYVILEHRGTRPVRALDRAVTRRRPRISLNNTGISISTAFFRRESEKERKRTVVYRARGTRWCFIVARDDVGQHVASSANDNAPSPLDDAWLVWKQHVDGYDSSPDIVRRLTLARPARRWWSYRPIVVQPPEENPRSNTCKTRCAVVLCTGSPHPRKRTFSPAHTCAPVEHTECPWLTALCVNAQVLQPREIAPLFPLRIYHRNVSGDKLLSSFITNKGYGDSAVNTRCTERCTLATREKFIYRPLINWHNKSTYFREK